MRANDTMLVLLILVIILFPHTCKCHHAIVVDACDHVVEISMQCCREDHSDHLVKLCMYLS